jgi:hypothetical protein
MSTSLMTRAYYSEAIVDFLTQNPEYILGVLTRNHQFALEGLQRNAWMAQIPLLKEHLPCVSGGHVLLEYSIPRMGKRVDVVVLAHGIVFLLEFKVGDDSYTAHALDQVLDYALDLKNFHDESRVRPVVPIVIATEAHAVEAVLQPFADRVFAPLKANKHTLAQVLTQAANSIPNTPIDPIAWRDSIYRPTPTIVEAAQALYRGHSVKDISRSDAGAINLSLTSKAIAEIIDYSKATAQKVICFITGVPGAGKTLAGLNIANERLQGNENEFAVFLSGNGPLVTVLREALARDQHGRSMIMGKKQTKKSTISTVKTFVQNIHHFRDEALINNKPPIERVAIFDEAQRAWTLEQTAAFMKRKRNVLNFAMSEPEFLISIMDRHADWAVVVCLIGGGQEINTGEAGLLEWLHAIQVHYKHWQVYCSPDLSDDEYMGRADITDVIAKDHLHVDPRLHLGVSIRSYRAENVAALVKAVLDVDTGPAQTLCQAINPLYPIVITRSMERATNWLKTHARGSERYGLLASSGALRLRPLGINVQANIEVVHWFLNGKEDVRSSYFLEDVATEFDIQGLELDWAGIVWDADLRYTNDDWTYHSFQGTTWRHVHAPTRRRYLKNAYRVLLTRARQGQVIVVPYGQAEDRTRKPEFYDGTFDYLRNIGFEII